MNHLEPDDTVRELVLWATNTGELYDRFLRSARKPHSNPYIAALDWLSLALTVCRLYGKECAGGANWALGVTPAQYLDLAYALQDYYLDHLGEFTADDLVDLDKRLGL